ncbi:MAG: DUF2807 domain-containing protein, partial [Prevotellaceae bacterium]|nr:DUF2807 domain-containing protein [Prevotellaceae bacterium]
MNRILRIVMMTLAASVSLFGCASTKQVTDENGYINRTYQVGSFDRISTSTIANITFVQSTNGKASVKAYGAEELVNLLQVSTVNGTLVIQMEKKRINNSRKKLEITITAPQLQGIEMSGVGNLKIDGLDTERLSIDNEGVGNLSVSDLTCKIINVHSEGVGNITL